MKKVLLFLITIIITLNSWADGNRTFTTMAPDVVVNGDQFRLTFTVNTQKVKEFRAPNITDFDVLMGPTRSTQSSTQIINGKKDYIYPAEYFRELLIDRYKEKE